jgi:aminoglycoside/choline kinase family phosphotransferase
MINYVVSCFKRNFDENVEEITPINAHASNKKLYRIRNNKRSIVASISKDTRENYMFLELTKVFRGLKLPVPEIYFDDLEAGLIIMEDLGSKTLLEELFEDKDRSLERISKSNNLTDHNQTESAHEIFDFFNSRSFHHYIEAVSFLPCFQIEAVHAIREKQYLMSELPSTVNSSIYKDLCKFHEEFLEKHSLTLDSEKLYKEFELFNKGFEEKLASQSHTAAYFMHGDFQGRNIILRPNEYTQTDTFGSISIIDYQGGKLGPLQYDIASLLYQSSASLSGKVRYALLDKYVEKLKEYISIDNEQFTKTFYFYVFTRIIQVLCRYAELGIIQRKQYFLKSIPLALENLVEILTQSTVNTDDNPFKNLLYFEEVIHQVIEEYT